MREPVVADVMSRKVITAVLETPFRELACALLAGDLGAVPVIDSSGRPIGIVTDADVATKLELHGGADLPLLLFGARGRARRRKAGAVTAAGVMTAPAPLIPADAPVGAALCRLSSEHTPYQCVVDGGGLLVGVFTHHDALRLFLRPDEVILADIERALAGLACRPRDAVTVCVRGGVAALDGVLTLRSTVDHAARLAACVPGVVTVHNHLRYEVDDLMITGL